MTHFGRQHGTVLNGVALESCFSDLMICVTLAELHSFSGPVFSSLKWESYHYLSNNVVRKVK